MDIGQYAKDDAWAMHPGLVEDRETSLLGTLKMWEKWDGKADDRIRVWFGARTPGGYASPEPIHSKYSFEEVRLDLRAKNTILTESLTPFTAR